MFHVKHRCPAAESYSDGGAILGKKRTMTAYGLLMCAYAYDLLGIGLIGNRGRIILGLIALGLAAAWIEGPAGWAGLALGVTTVLGLRRLGEWLRHEGGLQIVGLLLLGAVNWGAGYAGDMMRRAFEVLLPSPREDVPEPEIHAAPVVPPAGDTVYATPQMMRWTPGTDAGGTAGDTTTGPALTPVETYPDILGTVISGAITWTEGLNRAQAAFGVSKSKYARDMRALREEAA